MRRVDSEQPMAALQVLAELLAQRLVPPELEPFVVSAFEHVCALMQESNDQR